MLYHHATCFSPTKHTFATAVADKAFIGWPGLTRELVSKYLPEVEATVVGHIKQEQMHLQSTAENNDTEAQEDFYPTMEQPNVRTKDVIYKVFEGKDMAFMDLTGRFPKRSRSGNEYILIAYHYDSNVIWADPIKNRTKGVILQA